MGSGNPGVARAPQNGKSAIISCGSVRPYCTNTRDRLPLARRILDRQHKDMLQIIMITDGRICKNAFGLDAFIVAEICKGEAHFTTPYTPGQYVLMNYMDEKTKTIH